jgi:hypothetical protein
MSIYILSHADKSDRHPRRLLLDLINQLLASGIDFHIDIKGLEPLDTDWLNLQLDTHI